MLHHPHKSGEGLTWGNISPQVVITSKYLAVCPELLRPSITFPLAGDSDYTAGDVKGSCGSAVARAEQLPERGRAEG